MCDQQRLDREEAERERRRAISRRHRERISGVVCRHCHNSPVNRPRGLCWTCYYTPGLREQYPAGDSVFSRRGVGVGMKALAPLPEIATPCAAGSEDKVLVLIGRAGRGEQLFHPADGLAIASEARGPRGRTAGDRLNRKRLYRAVLRGSMTAERAAAVLGTTRLTILNAVSELRRQTVPA